MDTNRVIAIVALVIVVCFVVYILYDHHRDMDNFHTRNMRDAKAFNDELKKILADMQKKNEGRNERK